MKKKRKKIKEFNIPPVSIWPTLLETKLWIAKNKIESEVEYGIHCVENKVDKEIEKSKEYVKDVVNTLTKDPKIEGGKSGIKKAAEEYEVLYARLLKMYDEAIAMIKAARNENCNEIKNLIDKLEDLKKEKEELLKKRKKEFVVEHGIEIPYTTKVAGTTASITGPITGAIITVDLLYKYKKRKFNEAEMAEYHKASAEFQNKIDKKKKELRQDIAKGEVTIEKMVRMISSILDEIVKIEKEILELKISG